MCMRIANATSGRLKANVRKIRTGWQTIVPYRVTSVQELVREQAPGPEPELELEPVRVRALEPEPEPEPKPELEQMEQTVSKAYLSSSYFMLFGCFDTKRQWYHHLILFEN